jgi:hypothetical protein
MKRNPRSIVPCLLLALAAALLLPAQPGRAQAGTLSLVQTIEVGGSPDAIVVDAYGGRNDVLYFDAGVVRFIDGDTLQVDAEQISVPSSLEGWMVYDRGHHQTYVVTEVDNETNMRVSWDEIRVTVIAARASRGSFSMNDVYNESDPLHPADHFFGLNGLALKQPLAEGGNPARLIVDDTANGNLTLVDLNDAGTEPVVHHRYSYRASLCEESYCHWETNPANTLALETNHETLPIDDLRDDDVLYIADQNHRVTDPYGFPREGYLRAISLGHPGAPLNPVALPDVDMTGHWPFDNGFKGIDLAGPRDILYVASGQQSFNNGYVAEVDTAHGQVHQVITLQYGDEGFVHVDWADPRRAFVVTFDGFYNDPSQGLYLHLLYDGQVVDTLRLMEDYDEVDDLAGMVYDPWHGRLYLLVGSRVIVVGVSGAEPPPAGATATIAPEGGSLKTPDGGAEFDFPPGAVDQAVTVTYTPVDPSATGLLYGVRFFDLSAVLQGTTIPVTTFSEPYTVTLSYGEAERGPAVESTLGLYGWDGSRWQREPSSQVDAAHNRLQAWPDHMTLFAVLGETRRVHLPLAVRGEP